MGLLSRLSIRTKAIVVIVLVNALTLGAFSLLVIEREISTFEENLINETRLIARVAGDYSVIDLVFRDKEAAHATLDHLANVPNIDRAILFDGKDNPFAEFSRSSESQGPVRFRREGTFFDDDVLHVFLPITYDGERIGTIYLGSGTRRLSENIAEYLRNMLMLAGMVVVLAAILALAAQTLITRPIQFLAKTTKTISSNADYSIRVPVTTQDEIGVLCEGFNDMLSQIQHREIERAFAEEAVRKSESRFRNIIEQSGDAMYVVQDGHIVYLNPKFVQLLGLSEQEIIADPDAVVDAFSGFIRSTGELVESHGTQIFSRPKLEFKGHTVNKETYDFEANLAKIDWDNRSAALGTLRDVTHRRRNEQQLRQQQSQLNKYASELERSNRELNQFAYVTSHDLKAPLRAISSLSQWIEEDLEEVLTDETRKQMNLLRGRVERMEALINGILEYSRVGRIRTKLETVAVESLLDDIVDLLAPPKNFRVEIRPGMPTLTTEKHRIQQVFANLISNALKYVDRPDALVRISYQDREDFYEFSVEDNGPGIDPSYHDKVFVIFQTLQARDKYESTGVGLSIVKKIVEDKGGSVSLQSEPGKGARFAFTWPKIDPLLENG